MIPAEEWSEISDLTNSLQFCVPQQSSLGQTHSVFWVKAYLP